MVTTKRAFTMIEMIFAIVIIGLTVAGVSQMLTRSGETMEGGMSQEAVFLASMEAAKVFSHRWDVNSEDNTTELSYSKILDTNTSSDYDRTCINVLTGVRTTTTSFVCGANAALSVLRLGGIEQDLHRRFHSAPTAASSAAPEGVPDSDSNLSLTGEDGFKHDYNIVIASNFVGAPFDTGAAAGGTTNIKRTVVAVNNADTGNNLVTMRVYTYNIGEIDIARRTLQ
jgi:prepilin-type N-terminal cleavage/methylation domain-containing protein